MFRSYRETFRTDLKLKPPQTLQTFSCDICDESHWLSENDVEIHRKEAHFSLIRSQMLDNKESFCTVCMTLQESRSALISHVKSHHLLSSPSARRVEREIFICDYCNNIFFNKDILQVHIMFLHLWSTRERNLKLFNCPKCKKTCKLRSIWFHLQLHDIPSLTLCEICLAHFSSIQELKCHLKTHHMYYKCDICNYQTAKDSVFEMHLDKHRSSQSRPSNRVGKLVREVFKRHHSVASSVNSMLKYNIHNALRGLELPSLFNICSLCREICTEKTEAKQHILRDHMIAAEVKKPLRCLCGEQFFNKVLLKHHIFKIRSELRHKHRELNDKEEPEPQPTETLETNNSIQQYAVLSDSTATLMAKNIHKTIPEIHTKVLTDADTENSQTEVGDTEIPNDDSRTRKVSKDIIEMDTLDEIEISNTEERNIEIIVETAVPIEFDEMEKTKGDEIESEDASELTYIYAEVDEDQLVTIDTETNEEVIGF